MLVVAGIAVGLIAFILYALDRKAKGEPIAWDTAAKLTMFSGLVTSGVVFATTADVPAESIATDASTTAFPSTTAIASAAADASTGFSTTRSVSSKSTASEV